MNRCTNSEPGTYGHECGRAARWIGTHPSGHRQPFCGDCRERGYEARHITQWETAPPVRPADRPIGSRVVVWNFGRHTGTVTEHAPRMEIQGRERIAEDWIAVRLDCHSHKAPWDLWAGDPSLTEPEPVA